METWKVRDEHTGTFAVDRILSNAAETPIPIANGLTFERATLVSVAPEIMDVLEDVVEAWDNPTIASIKMRADAVAAARFILSRFPAFPLSETKEVTPCDLTMK